MNLAILLALKQYTFLYIITNLIKPLVNFPLEKPSWSIKIPVLTRYWIIANNMHSLHGSNSLNKKIFELKLLFSV